MTTARAVADIYPLTPMQQGILFHALGAPDEPHYRQQEVLQVTGVADEGMLRGAFEDLVARHAALRTGFAWETGGQPLQVVFGRAALPLPVEDLRGAGEADRERRVAEVLAEELARPFDLRRPPILHVRALRVGADAWRVVATHHHAVVDGWSLPILHAELAELLAARVAGRAPRLDAPPPFRDYVRWLGGRDGDAEGCFSRLLGDVEHPTPLGVDRVGRVSPPGGAIEWGQAIAQLPTPGDAHPGLLARRRGVLPSAVVHAAWGLLLARCAGVDDVVFGMTVSGRPPELDRAASRVGMFVNTVPVRVRARGSERVGEWLRDVQDRLLRVREHEHVALTVAQRRSRVPLNRPLFETVLAFQNYWRPEQDALRTPEGVGVQVVDRVERTSVPVAVAVALLPGGIWVRVDHDRRRLDAGTGERLARRCARLIAAVAAAGDDVRLDELPLLEPGEARLPAPAGPPALPLAATDRVVAALAPGAPALPALAEAARAAGAALERRDPLAPGPAAGATVVAGPPAAVRAMAAGGSPRRALVVDEPPPPALVAALQERGCAVLRWVGGRALAAVDGPGRATWLGRVPGGYVAGARGRRAIDGAAGELVVREPGRDVRTGVRARALADGSLEELGRGPGDDSVWLEHQLASCPGVAEAAVVAGPDGGQVAWIVPAAGAAPDPDALLDRLRHTVPPELLPAAFEVVPALPLTSAGLVDRAVLAGPPAAPAPAPPPAPLAGRLARLPAERRAAFLDRLRTAARRTRGLRRRRLSDAPPSVQQEQWRQLAPRALRAWNAGGERRAAPDELDVESLAVSPSPGGEGGLDHGDYAAWQGERARAGELAGQREHWRAALAGAPPSRMPPDRVPPGASGAGTAVLRAGVRAGAPQWLAALGAALAQAGRDGDVVLGVVTRPELPPELAGAPGPFSRMLPVRLAPAPDAGLGALAREAADALAAARRHGDLPWPELRELLAEEPRLSVAVHDAPGRLAAHAGAALGLDVAPAEGGGTGLTAVFDRSRLLPETVTALLDRACALLARGLADPEAPLDAAAAVTPAGRERLLAWSVAEPAGEGAPSTLHGLVLGRARTAPDATAVEGPDGRLSYAELAARAGELASRLRAQGIVAGDLVAVCLPRTSAMVWSALAVLMAGGAYVPLDPRHPDARLTLLCADAGVRAVVTTAAWRGRFAGEAAVLAADEPADGPAAGESAAVDPASAAYVIYTSGSTGTPKGVVVEHRQVADFCRQIAAAYRIDAGSRVLGFAALTFDVSVFDLWATLAAGATLVLASDEERLSVDRLQRLLEERRVSVAELPPILMPQLDPARLPDLRLVSVGGEAPPGILVDTWASDGREFWNGYGPAETTVAVTLMRCLPPAGRLAPPIGLPMAGRRAYVVDERLRLVPPGVPGELCIAGAGVARGYLGRAALTAERFAPDPFAGPPGERMYRTGDLARWTPDGVLEFLGRVDRQVKIRGVRVEPGEVEAVLAADPRVRQVVVDAIYDEGIRHLAAFVVPADPSARLTLAEVREITGERLPDALVPSRLALLERMPLTPSGKVDRRALPMPARPGDEVNVEPDGEWSDTERAVARELIAPLLGLASVGRRDSFFHLGGNSLQATQVTARVRDRFGVEVSLTDFFADPTVARLARLVEEAGRRAADERADLYAGPAPAAASRPMLPGDRLPLSHPQAALWRAERAAGPIPAHNVPLALRFRGPLDLDAMRRAFGVLLERHPALRVSFEESGGQPEQRVLEAGGAPFEVVDAPGPDAVGRLVREEGDRPFDLGAGPPVRVRVHRVAPDDHVVQWTIHHIVTDAWSVGLQIFEIGQLYRSLAGGGEPGLAPLPATYADFVAWQREYVASPALGRDAAWWREWLAGAPASLGLPADAPRAGHAFAAGWRNVRLGEEITRGALALSQWSGATLYMVLLAAYAVTVASVAGGDDVLVVSPIASRLRSEWEALVGFFVNRVIVRVRVDDGLTFRELLQGVRTASAEAFARQAVPFELLLAELGLPASAVAVNFAVQNAPVRQGGFTGLDVSVVDDDSGRDFGPMLELYSPVGARFELSLVLRQFPDGIRGGLEYDAGLFGPERAADLASRFAAVLARATGGPNVSVRDLRHLVR